MKRMIKNSNIELELQDKVTGCDTTVTVFENVLKNLFEINKLTPYELLDAVNIDITNIKKKIVGSITSHPT